VGTRKVVVRRYVKGDWIEREEYLLVEPGPWPGSRSCTFLRSRHEAERALDDLAPTGATHDAPWLLSRDDNAPQP
jgi:hypothetical protein